MKMKFTRYTLRSATESKNIADAEKAKQEKQIQIDTNKEKKRLARLLPRVMKDISKLIDKKAKEGETYLHIEFVKKGVPLLDIDYKDFEKIEKEVYATLESFGYEVYHHKYPVSYYYNKIAYFVVYWDGRGEYYAN